MVGMKKVVIFADMGTATAEIEGRGRLGDGGQVQDFKASLRRRLDEQRRDARHRTTLHQSLAENRQLRQPIPHHSTIQETAGRRRLAL